MRCLSLPPESSPPSGDVEEVVDDDGLRRGGRVREERAELRRDGADAGLVHFEHLLPRVSEMLANVCPCNQFLRKQYWTYLKMKQLYLASLFLISW